MYEASHRILVHVTLDTGRVQRDHSPHQAVDQPEPHNIGCPILVERLRHYYYHIISIIIIIIDVSRVE